MSWSTDPEAAHKPHVSYAQAQVTKSSQQIYGCVDKKKKDLDLLFHRPNPAPSVQATPKSSLGTDVTSTALNASLREAGERVPYPGKCPWKRQVWPLLGVSVGEEPARGCSIQLSRVWWGRTSRSVIWARTTGTARNHLFQLILCYLKWMREEKILILRALWDRVHLKSPRQNTHHILFPAL